MPKSLISLIALASLVACGGGESAVSNVSVYRHFGSLQCTGGGASLSALALQLTEANIQVVASSCGIDGNVYPAVCGAADGRIGIFDIPAAQAQASAAIGFTPLRNLPAATQVACP